MVYTYKQQEDVDYTKTCAKVVKTSLFWLCFEIAAK